MTLYDKPLKGKTRLTVADLREMARFNRIVKGYLKMCGIEKHSGHVQR